MKKYILSIDQGTTSTRVIIFNKKMNIVAKAQREINNYYPQEGWVEHDANEIWLSVLACMADVILKSGIDPKEVDSIGITNQRETTVIWDKKTGLPIYRAIVWQSRQSEYICEELRRKNLNDWFKNKTGLLIDPYFSATKIKWILENVKGSKEKAEKGELLFGTIDSWLLFKLTGDKVHATDFSNASRTLLYNIYDLKWDEEILNELDIPLNMLPEVKPSSGLFGYTAFYHFFNQVIPITGIAGDQNASLFGHGCFEQGMTKNTYGTGCFLLMNTGDKPVKSKFGLLTTIAWGFDNKIQYALEGSIFVAGNAINWLKEGLELFDKVSETELMAENAGDSKVYFVPAFVGLGAPYWNSNARGTIFNLSAGINKNNIVKATLESLAYQSKDVIDLMNKESNIELKVLRVDGGVTNNNYCMQFQANILNKRVTRGEISEITALGVGMLAGIETGFYPSQEKIKNLLKVKCIYEPQISKEQINKLYKGWKNAVKATIYFSNIEEIK